MKLEIEILAKLSTPEHYNKYYKDLVNRMADDNEENRISISDILVHLTYV